MDKQNIRIHLRAYDNKILDLSTIEIYNFIRALSRPYPGAFTFINKTIL